MGTVQKRRADEAAGRLDETSRRLKGNRWLVGRCASNECTVEKRATQLQDQRGSALDHARRKELGNANGRHVAAGPLVHPTVPASFPIPSPRCTAKPDRTRVTQRCVQVHDGRTSSS